MDRFRLSQLWWRLIRTAFHLFYNQFAWTYDIVSWLVSQGQWRQWQFAALPYVQGERILELAHGTGHLLPQLAQRGTQVVGYDLSAFMGRITQKRLQKLHLDIPLVQGRAQQLPFADDCFDTIVATFPTEFILQPATLHALKRIMAPQGRLVIVPEGHHYDTDVISRLIGGLYRITGQSSGHQTQPNPTMWVPWQAQIARAGFSSQVYLIDLGKSGATVIVVEPHSGA